MPQKHSPSKELYRAVNIPLPSKPLNIGPYDASELVIQKLNAYFEDLIRNYPEATKTLMRNMYYNNTNIEAVEGLIDQEGAQANWILSHDGQSVTKITMVIDAKLRNSPIIFHWNKIHEIAVHIGQLHQRISQVGLVKFIDELPFFQKFTEQSVAPCEKILIDSLTNTMIAPETRQLDRRSKSMVLKDLAHRRDMSYEDYLLLKHRPSDHLTKQDQQGFLSIPSVKTYLEDQFIFIDTNNLSSGEESTEPPSHGLFLIKGNHVHVIPLYRGDGRAHNVIFPAGFTSRGKNPDLLAHAHPGAKESGYISTSRSRSIAFGYGRNNAHHTQAYIYEVNPQKEGVDVFKTLQSEVQSGRVDPKVCHLIATEKEIAVPHKIPAQDIKGVWILEKTSSGQWLKDRFISNPNYQAPLNQATTVLRQVGRGVTAVGAVVDATNLWFAFQESHQSGDYHQVFNEGARIVGGWTGAATLGTTTSKIGALCLAPLGPVASLAGGIICGVIGSAVGYYYGGITGQEIQGWIEKFIKEQPMLLKAQELSQHENEKRYNSQTTHSTPIQTTESSSAALVKARDEAKKKYEAAIAEQAKAVSERDALIQRLNHAAELERAAKERLQHALEVQSAARSARIEAETRAAQAQKELSNYQSAAQSFVKGLEYFKGPKETRHLARECFKEAIQKNPNHSGALVYLGVMSKFGVCGGTYDSKASYDYFKRAAQLNEPFAKRMLSRPSTTPDNDGEGQMAAVSQAMEDKDIRDAITAGRFELYTVCYSSPPQPRATSDNSNRHHDPVRNDDKMSGGGNNGGPGLFSSHGTNSSSIAPQSSRFGCDYVESNATGDLYRCSSRNADLHLSGRNGDATRTATFFQDGRTGSTTAHATGRSNDTTYYGTDALGGDRDLSVRDHDHHGCDTSNRGGDWVDRVMDRR